jgi:hypothetical protein
VRGKVALQGGVAITEPVAIERVCNGAVRREGYTDFKGNFEFQLGQGTEGRDATESGRDVFQNSWQSGTNPGSRRRIRYWHAFKRQKRRFHPD